jgi:hypothetical protein
MSTLSASELARIKEIADLLMPATADLPAAGNTKSFDGLINLAVKASAIPLDQIQEALAALPQRLDWKAIQDFASAKPMHFETLSVITSGAYVMSPEVLQHLGFPADRRNPAGQMDAADEYETGILDPVVNRGSVFRDPRLKT